MKFSKKAFLVLLFSLFSFSAFAAPGKSGPGGGGGRHDSPNNHGGNPGKKGPVFSNNARPKSSPAPKKSGNGGSKKDKPVPSSKNTEPAPSSPMPQTEGHSPAHAPFSDSERIAMIQSPVNEPDIIYYRGNRILLGDGDFALQNIKTERINSDTVALEVTFSQSVNPRTFTANSIFIDGKAISSKTKFSFNKKGDTIKVSLSVPNENFTLMIKDVESFDGTVLEPITIEVKK